MGITLDDFWKLTPHKLKMITHAHIEKIKELDRLNWILGQYIQSAVGVAVEHCLNGNKAHSKYITEPILKDYGQDFGLTQEEIDDRELKKLIANEEAWIRNDKARGLKQADIGGD